ncbi:MAG TPA: hypothetical protein VE136_08500 [Anaerolineales bacterium]|jgi:hypothetical protein|nr:hypothetical protein [Anaerolineales bacterium]
MAEERPSRIIDFERHPGEPVDLLHITLPVPRLRCLPKEVRQHLRASRRERLLAFRSLIDSAIEWLAEPEEDQKHRKTERVKID